MRPSYQTTSAFVALFSLLLQSGCFSLLGDAQGGYVTSTRFESKRSGAAFQLSGGLNIGNTRDAEVFGPGLSLRSKFTEQVKQFSVSPHLYILPGSGVTPYARLGTNLFQFESVDSKFAYGMFSPYSEIGLFVFPFVLSTFAEYDLRFTEQKNEGFIGVMAGFGAAASTKSLR